MAYLHGLLSSTTSILGTWYLLEFRIPYCGILVYIQYLPKLNEYACLMDPILSAVDYRALAKVLSTTG